MGFYDLLDKQAAADPINAELDNAIEMFIQKFGKAPLISTEESYTRDKLIKALKEAIESGHPGAFEE